MLEVGPSYQGHARCGPVWITFAGSRSASMVTRSDRRMPNVAFQPAESVTWTGAIGVPSCGSTGNQAQLWLPISPRKNPAHPLQLADAVRGQEPPAPTSPRLRPARKPKRGAHG